MVVVVYFGLSGQYWVQAVLVVGCQCLGRSVERVLGRYIVSFRSSVCWDSVGGRFRFEFISQYFFRGEIFQVFSIVGYYGARFGIYFIVRFFFLCFRRVLFFLGNKGVLINIRIFKIVLLIFNFFRVEIIGYKLFYRMVSLSFSIESKRRILSCFFVYCSWISQAGFIKDFFFGFFFSWGSKSRNREVIQKYMKNKGFLLLGMVSKIVFLKFILIWNKCIFSIKLEIQF